MRKIVLASVVVLFSSMLSAQTYLGLRGGYGSTWIMNKNISDAGDELDYKGSYAGNFAFHGIQLLSKQSGVGLQVGVSTISQQTQSTIPDEEYVNEMKFKYTDIGIFYTYLAEGGLYLEVGPQFSMRKDEVEEAFDLDDENLEETVIDPFLNKSTIFAVLGIGGNISLSDNLRLGLGVQLGYGLNDLTEEMTVETYGTSEFTSEITDLAQGYDLDEVTLEESIDYQASHPIFGRLNFGLYYVIGGNRGDVEMK